jgi:hypothetical protein
MTDVDGGKMLMRFFAQLLGVILALVLAAGVTALLKMQIDIRTIQLEQKHRLEDIQRIDTSLSKHLRQTTEQAHGRGDQ